MRITDGAELLHREAVPTTTTPGTHQPLQTTRTQPLTWPSITASTVAVLNWFLLLRARQRAATRRYSASADRDLRRRVSVALDFPAWMDERGLALADVAQEHIDDWIAGATSQRRYLIRYFLKWTTSHRLTAN
ncbi:hypothetical protein ACN6LA_007273 [Streptomyces sp. SAS_269]|uniref:hypothetical protein n=1 Tax=Streptomyces sp. SAS_269 TaxID=3412749 RepID=UPI00403D0F9D